MFKLNKVVLILSSSRGSGLSQLVDFLVLLLDVAVDLLVVETIERRSDAVLLSHFEVLSEVLVTAPPVGPDHVQLLVSPDLMEV